MNSYQLLSRYILFYAAGDAVGKATEFMTQEEIKSGIGSIDGLIDPAKSRNHSDLAAWDVTDDTEQNLFLLRRFLHDGRVAIENTVSALVDWVSQTDAVAKKYIGPSSLAALNEIKAGGDPLETGLDGTTCGAMMRTPAAVFASRLNQQDLDECVYQTIVPTHNTSIAMESAYAYAYALDSALEGESMQCVIDAALRGCEVGMKRSPWIWAAPTLRARLEYMRGMNLESWSEERLKSFMYGVLGSGLPSYETSSCVFALLLHSSDPLKSIFIASECGGDTDTIAALAGALASMIDRKAQLPSCVAGPVMEHNNLDICI